MPPSEPPAPSAADPPSSTAPEAPPAPKGPVVCVFCGSRPGTSPVHLAAARALAHAFATHGITLIYGGGTVGLMGELARTLVALAGPTAVHGIIPAPLIRYEQAGRDTDAPPAALQLHGRTTVVPDMHTRKRLMAQEVRAGGPGSGFVALSGGYGTLEELMEMVTWNQLGIQAGGVVVYNVAGYWDGVLAWVRGAVAEGFVSAANGGIMVEAGDAEGVVRALREYVGSGEVLRLDWSEG